MNPAVTVWVMDMDSSFGLVADRQRKSPEDFSRGLGGGKSSVSQGRSVISVRPFKAGTMSRKITARVIFKAATITQTYRHLREDLSA